MLRPAYFAPIRDRSAARWDQLDRDPELAAPWHQLFKQVQSPRHVVSELLQNADDAGATEASVALLDADFVFTHNGEDFKEDHFASLCRFGYSNKRALHTIGFRGIGFKSVFSLGPTVTLTSPTLAVAFHNRRFTEPEWLPDVPPSTDTSIRIETKDAHVRIALSKNLDDWLASPLSLLFFKSVRKLRVNGKEIRWDDVGPGPVANSRWYALNGDPNEAYLLIRSELAAFPLDALQEIRQERMVGPEHDVEFPPCAVEIVLGASGRMFVVLPTGVETELPFAINAPFIQDAARYKIKDPGVSPTNRWLLSRAGELAAASMQAWLQKPSASLAEKAEAYQLLPDVDPDDTTLDGACAWLVEETVRAGIENRPILLTDQGKLVASGEAVRMPAELRQVWPDADLSSLFDEEERPALSGQVTQADAQKLLNWQLLDELTKEDIISTLRFKSLRRPGSWRQLLHLWAYIAPEVTSSRYYRTDRNIKIIPAQGQTVLYSLSEIVRLGEKRLLQSDADWEFLAEHLLVLNPNWPRYLAEQRRLLETGEAAAEGAEIAAAYAVLDALGLQDASDANKVLDQVASRFFEQDAPTIPDCVRLAQIAVKLNASAGPAFRFVTKDGRLRPTSHDLLYDRDGNLDTLLPDDWAAEHLLHPEYESPPVSCSHDEWRQWLASGKAGLWGFVPFSSTRQTLWGRRNIEMELKRRQFPSPPTYHYRTDSFQIEDWDFPEELWGHWTDCAQDDPKIWTRIVDIIANQPEGYWTRARSAKVSQIATTGNTRQITYDPVLPAWVMKCRELACLPDTRGIPRKPGELLRRTPSTEPVMDVEPFVHGLLDRESTRPLLSLLGVRDTPAGPDQLLAYLRAFSTSDKPPIHEVEKWYRRLDQMLDTCSTLAAAAIRTAFQNERIILTEDGSWTTALGAFLAPDDLDAPGVALVRSTVRDLALWHKVGVADQPTADLAIAWLHQLPSGKALSLDDARRVRTLLPRHAHRIWHECGHWLTLAGEWTPIDSIKYALTMQSLVGWSHLHEWVKRSTADLQRLPVELIDTPSIKAIPTLADRIEERLERPLALLKPQEDKDWLQTLGALLARTKWEDEGEQARVRALGQALYCTVWQVAPKLEIVPYIDGTPAGTSRQVEALWQDGTLFVIDRPAARLAKSIAQELGRSFRRPEITDAIKICFDRPATFIVDYVEENFTLVPADQVPVPTETQVRADASKTQQADNANLDRDQELPNAGHAPDSANASTTDEGPLQSPSETEEPQAADETKPARPPSKQRAPQHPFIERFARTIGFALNGDGRYHHPDGSLIAKQSEDVFPWQRITATGDIVKRYWVKDHCIDLEPLQIESEVWSLIESCPEEYALILADSDGKPIELTGSRLRTMKEQGALVLYPASYRLKVDHDRKH